MNLLLFLHFYQPYNQYEDILERIIHESYYPITEIMLANPKIRFTANIAGSLTELLVKHKHQKLLDNFAVLMERGQLEPVASAMYHPILPLLPKDEVLRQISLNEKTNRAAFGSAYAPQGFFPPEMAIDSELLNLLKLQGYKWCAVSENAIASEQDSFKFTVSSAPDLVLYARDKKTSGYILSAQAQSGEELYNLLGRPSDVEEHFAVMDAETFGHHRVGFVPMLESMANCPAINMLTVSESNLSPKTLESLRASTWSNTEQDFWLDKEKTQSTHKNAFILWNDPSNKIHQAQWKLTELAISQVSSFETPQARELLDYALASDQFWWASAKPWWSLEMIEYGAYMLLSAVKACATGADVQGAQELYNEILEHAFYWQRSGHIRRVHREANNTMSMPPLKDRTPDEWFNQLVLEFEHDMNAAAANQNFELAIKWRDAITKIDLGTDQFDVLHVVDDLWMSRTTKWGVPVVKPFLQHDWEEFSDFAKAHFRGVKTKEDFLNWKNHIS